MFRNDVKFDYEATECFYHWNLCFETENLNWETVDTECRLATCGWQFISQ